MTELNDFRTYLRTITALKSRYFRQLVMIVGNQTRKTRKTS